MSHLSASGLKKKAEPSSGPAVLNLLKLVADLANGPIDERIALGSG
jgi:hypothetical protein